MLLKYLRGHDLGSLERFDQPITLELDTLTAARNFEEVSSEVLLTQSGYLTIKQRLSSVYVQVDYPNREVYLSMGRLYADELTRSQKESKAQLAH